MTLTQLAKLAHVSVSTASKAFSMSPEVNEQTRDMIFALAKKHGCFKRYYNAAYPKLVVAVILQNFHSNSALLSALQTRLAEYDCEFCVACSRFSEERELELINYYENHAKVDGIILISPYCTVPESVETPIAVIDAYNEQPERVIQMNRSIDSAYTKAIHHFTDRGITDIAFIADRLSRSKIELYKKYMTEALGGWDEKLIAISDSGTAEEAISITEGLLDRTGVPRALISAHNNVTIGALTAIRQRGLSVPEDIAVITFSDSPHQKLNEPPLTGVEIFDEECATLTADALIACINGQSYQTHLYMDCELIWRRSSEI